MWYHNIGGLAMSTNERVRLIPMRYRVTGSKRPDPPGPNAGRGLATTHRLTERLDRIHHSKKTERHSALPVHSHARKDAPL
jgi:hypothetical protein